MLWLEFSPSVLHSETSEQTRLLTPQSQLASFRLIQATLSRPLEEELLSNPKQHEAGASEFSWSCLCWVSCELSCIQTVLISRDHSELSNIVTGRTSESFKEQLQVCERASPESFCQPIGYTCQGKKTHAGLRTVRNNYSFINETHRWVFLIVPQ